MATNLDQPLSTDVAKSLPRLAANGRLRAASNPRERNASIWLVAGPTVLVLALLTLATAYAGAFKIAQWAPPSLFVLIVLLTLVLRGGAQRLPDRWLALSLGGAWGLAAWAALSATWAASPAGALEGAGELTMYAAIFSLPLLALGDLRALRVAAYGVVGGVVLIGVYTLGHMLVDGASIFLAGRLNGPVEYRNATALLFCLAYWPLIVIAATRGRGRALRAVCLGLAELMLGLAFLTQSRGVVLGLGCGALVVLVLGPDQVRRAWLALLSLVLLAAMAPWLLTPYHAFTGPAGAASAADIATAARALLALVAVGIAVGFLLAVFDAGLRVASPAMARVRRGARLALVVVVAAGIAGGLAAVHGDPAHELQVKWREFKSLQTTSTSATRYTSAGGQRYDLWRVALNELSSNPVGGVGEGSYQFGYYLRRRSNRNLDDPHGLLFQLGGELGVMGLALFALIPLGLVGSLRRWWRVAPLPVRREVCGLSAAGATFVGQSLVDWMWRIPGLTALGLLCLGVAAALLARTGAAREAEAQMVSGADRSLSLSDGSSNERALGATRSHRARVRPRFVLRMAAAIALLAAVALTASLYLSDFYVRRARDEAGHSPPAQLADARSAASLAPWSVDPHYLEAAALESMGERAAARAQLLDAQRMEPANAVPLGLLGDFEARGGEYAKARIYYRRALALDPLDVGLAQLVRSGGRT
ncbi:MAG: O-antigen ligase family protein [Solirubrobacterales bacterium]